MNMKGKDWFRIILEYVFHGRKEIILRIKRHRLLRYTNRHSDFYKAPTLNLFKAQEPVEPSSIEQLEDHLAKLRETFAVN